MPQIIIKCLMTAVFLWSGFFWSGVTILQIFINSTEQRYLPMIAFAIFSLALLLIRILGIISEKAKREEEFNNRPTESIFDRHSEE